MSLLDNFPSMQHESGLAQGNQPAWMLTGSPADTIIPRILPDAIAGHGEDPDGLPSSLFSPAEIEDFVIEKGLLGNEAEARRRLAARPVQPLRMSPCFFEGDGCLDCWVDNYYQIGAWSCPDFCGEGKSFDGHLTSTFDETKGEYVSDEAECRMENCLSMEDQHCYLFEENPSYGSATKNEDFWTCSEVCPDTTNADIADMKNIILSPAMYGLIITVGIGFVAVMAFALQSYSRRNPYTIEEAQEFV